MTGDERVKILGRVGAMIEVGAQQRLDASRRVGGGHVGFDQPANRSLVGVTAADVDVIALDLIAVLVHRNLRADQADIADVMLRAGIRAAGEMDVYGLVKFELFSRCLMSACAWLLVSAWANLQ